MMGENADRKFDWVAGLAVVSGVTVLVPSLLALAMTVASVIALLF
jgi:hypothetical protein